LLRRIEAPGLVSCSFKVSRGASTSQKMEKRALTVHSSACMTDRARAVWTMNQMRNYDYYDVTECARGVFVTGALVCMKCHLSPSYLYTCADVNVACVDPYWRV
jgi:hypothetical protein